MLRKKAFLTMLYKSPFLINSGTDYAPVSQVSDNVYCMEKLLFFKRMRLSRRNGKSGFAQAYLEMPALTELPRAHHFLEYKYVVSGMERVSGYGSWTAVVSRFVVNTRAAFSYRSA
jgi:hypothetical protein